MINFNHFYTIFIFLFLSSGIKAQETENTIGENTAEILGAITRFDTLEKKVYLIFSAHEYREGAEYVYQVLHNSQVPAAFFFTGDFYREEKNHQLIKKLLKDGHYLGAHSDKHLLYASWEKRDSTLISEAAFREDVLDNYREMRKFGISKNEAPYYLPPYEWYNSEISKWTKKIGLQFINLTPGTGTARDYTWPEMGNRYADSETILKDLLYFEDKEGLNGSIILVHIGTDSRRKDKFYLKLPDLINALIKKGYQFTNFPKIEVK